MAHQKHAPGEVILYNTARSSCSWRVRTGLHFKGIRYTYVNCDRAAGETATPEFLAINPMKQLPALRIDGHTLSESVAILEYLEEVYPDPPLLPKAPEDRAIVRKLVETINAGTQPLQNTYVLETLVEMYGPGADVMWAEKWIRRGLQAFEDIISKTAGKCCFGDSLTMADVFLIPQLYNAHHLNIDLSAYPTCLRIEKDLGAHAAIKSGRPEKQPLPPHKH
ncbi:maleylacetoacetate isomerase-like [Klebsormidium nitens]|uniref:Maleylacetoacetate isomerase-like n=1 Tax=Klebsormidium nitens TaxID=105231 RepID=A0A0U9I7B4_KLENI|nr:maleylacetoacetate isomerase-like [Klebsormidium nitens]|eukprot:GAQ82668.1 maleylacetoacetate isomerase-like [Klebsormidium nitens]